MAQRTYAIFIGTNPVWISDDEGSTWDNVPATGIPLAQFILNITVDTYNGYNSIVTTTSFGLYKSINGGAAYNVIPGTNFTLNETQYINSLDIIAVGQNILLSSNGGNSFTVTSFNPVVTYGAGAINTPTYYAKNVFFDSLSNGYISIFDKLFRSYDGGVTWVPANGGNPISPGIAINDIVAISANVTVITPDGIYYSDDQGETFTQTQALSVVSGDNALDIFNTNVYAFDANGDIWKSVNYGLTFSNVNSIAVNSQYKDLFICSPSRVIFLSPDTTIGSSGALSLTTDGAVNITVSENVNARPYALDGSIETPCGECPGKFEFNPETGLCEAVVESPPLCPEGYVYNPITGQCDQTGDVCGELDIIISMDNSASVEAPEFVQLQTLATSIANSLSDELLSGQVQIGVVQWASAAAVTQILTTDLADVLTAIALPQLVFPNDLTNHTDAICVSHNELYNGVNARAGATKIYLVITDGPFVAPKDVSASCTYDGTTYTAANNTDYQPFRDLCTAMKQDGLKIIVSALGTTTEINTINAAFLYGPAPSTTLLPDAVPTLDSNGAPLYTASDFATAESQVTSIVDSLCIGPPIDAPTCPEGCATELGIDGRGVCMCTEQVSVSPCCFELTDCSGLLDPIYTNTDLSEYAVAAKILQFQGSDACWQVEKLDQICSDAVEVTVVEVFDTCNECLPKYFTLDSCVGDITIYAVFSTELLAVNNKVAQFLIEGVPTCFSVTQNEGTPPEEPIVIEVLNGPYADCECCLPQPEPTPEPFVRTTQKPVKKFYHITDSDCDIRTNVKFANNYYKLFRTIKNGLENPCGPVDFDKLWIEKELSDYSRINPPDQCVPAPTPVIPEECPIAPVVECTPPTNASGSGNLN
jgi:hypothetical protein